MYLWLMDPDPGGPKTCRSPALIEKLQNLIKFCSKKKTSSFLYTFLNYPRNWCLSLRRGRPSSARSWTVEKVSRSATMPLARSVYRQFLFLTNARNFARQVTWQCRLCLFQKNARMPPVRRVCRLCLFLINAWNTVSLAYLSSLLISKKYAKCRLSGWFAIFSLF